MRATSSSSEAFEPGAGRLLDMALVYSRWHWIAWVLIICVSGFDCASLPRRNCCLQCADKSSYIPAPIDLVVRHSDASLFRGQTVPLSLKIPLLPSLARKGRCDESRGKVERVSGFCPARSTRLRLCRIELLLLGAIVEQCTQKNYIFFPASSTTPKKITFTVISSRTSRARGGCTLMTARKRFLRFPPSAFLTR